MEEEETSMDIQHSPLFKLKRKVLMMTLFLFYFLCGLEYSITIPPAILDNRYPPANETFLLVESGLYPLGALLTSSILGHVYDRTKKIRSILIGVAYLQIIGNFIYAIEFNEGLSLFGRFVSGLGDGFIAVSVAEITYLYEDYDRIGMLCFLETGRVLGFLNGAVVNYLIIKWTTRHQWTFHDKTLPGYIMGCAWTLMTLITFCSVHNLALEVIVKYNLNDSPFLRKRTRIYNASKNKYEDIKEGENEDSNPFNTIEELSVSRDGSHDSDSEDSFIGPDFSEVQDEEKEEEEEEEFVEEAKTEEVTFEEKADKIIPIPEEEPKPTPTLRERIRLKYESTKEKMSDYSKVVAHRSHISQIFHIEVALLMVINFVFCYSQTTFLLFCSYVPAFEYTWKPPLIGITYVVGVTVIVGMLIIMYFLRHHLAKKSTLFYIIIVALALIQISLALLIYESVPKNIRKRVSVFIISGVLMFLSIPFSLVCFKTLLTSLVRPGIQGTLQGMASSVMRLALIIGFLLSVVTVHNRQVYAAIMTGICYVTLISLFLSYEWITRRQTECMMISSY